MFLRTRCRDTPLTAQNARREKELVFFGQGCSVMGQDYKLHVYIALKVLLYFAIVVKDVANIVDETQHDPDTTLRRQANRRLTVKQSKRPLASTQGQYLTGRRDRTSRTYV